MPMSQFMEIALYDPSAGFYATHGRAGRGGDFITSPEVGNLFGRVLGQALDTWWRILKRPNPFFVVEAGAGVGTLAHQLIELDLACSPALRYIVVEKSAILRNEQTGFLPLRPAENVLDPGDPAIVRLKEPVVASMTELPNGPFTGVILANELLDNMPVDIFERRHHHWYEVCAGVSKEGGLEETLVDLDIDDPRLARLDKYGAAAPDGGRLPLQDQSIAWVNSALGRLDRGKLVLFDYARTSRWMSVHPCEDWLRTYRNHRPGGSPFDLPGTQDITCELAIDQIADGARRPDVDRTQAEFLDAHGLREMVSEARDAWHGRVATGDLASLKARSMVQESRAISDPNGLGRYRALEWNVPGLSDSSE